MPQVLHSLKISECSLVDRPANAETDPLTGKRIPRAVVALFKADTDAPNPTQQGAPMTLEQIEKKITDQDALLAKMATDDAATKAENGVLKTEIEVLKMSAKQKKAFTAMPEDKKKAYHAGDAAKKKSLMNEFGADGEDGEDGEDGADGKDGKPGKDGKDKAKKVDEILKASDIRISKVEADNAVLKAENVAITKAARVAHFTKRAEDELPHTPGTPVEKGETLMQLADSLGGEDSDKFKRMVATMKAADAALKPSFNEIGKWGGGKIPAGKQLEAKAEEIAKRDKIDLGHAMAKAMDEAPELYVEYSQSRVQPRT